MFRSRVPFYALAVMGFGGPPPVLIGTAQSLVAGSDPNGAAAALNTVVRGSGYYSYPNGAKDLYQQFVISQPTLLTIPARCPDMAGMYGVRFTSGNGLPVTVTTRILSPDSGAIGFPIMIQPGPDGPGTITIDLLPVNGFEYRMTLNVIYNAGGSLFQDTRYVDPVSGSDGAAGTSLAPWATVNYGLTQSPSFPNGLVLKLKAGTHDLLQGPTTQVTTANNLPVIVQPNDGVTRESVKLVQATGRTEYNVVASNVIWRNLYFDTAGFKDIDTYQVKGGNVVWHGCSLIDGNTLNGGSINGPAPYGYSSGQLPQDWIVTEVGTTTCMYKCSGVNYNFVGAGGYIGGSFDVSSDGFILSGSDFAVLNSTLHQAFVCEPRYHTDPYKVVQSVVFNGVDTNYGVTNMSVQDQAKGYFTNPTTGARNPYTSTITFTSLTDAGSKNLTEQNGEWMYCLTPSPGYQFDRCYWFLVNIAAKSITFQDYPDHRVASGIQADLDAGREVRVQFKKVQHSDAIQNIGQYRYNGNIGNAYFQRVKATGYELQGLIQPGPANNSTTLSGMSINGRDFTVDAPNNTYTIAQIEAIDSLSQTAFVSYNEDRNLFGNSFEEGTGLYFKTGVCAGMEFPLVGGSTVNKSASGEGATVSGSVITLDQNSMTFTLNGNTAGNTNASYSGVPATIYLYDASGTKSFLVTAWDDTAKTVTVSGSPSVSGPSRWVMSHSPTGRPGQKIRTNPVATGDDVQLVNSGTQIQLRRSGAGAVVNGVRASTSNRIRPDRTSDVLYIPSATNGPYFKMSGTPRTDTGYVGWAGCIPLPTFADSNPHPWSLVRDDNIPRPTSIETRSLSGLAIGDTCIVTHGLQPGDCINIRGIYSSSSTAPAPPSNVDPNNFFQTVSAEGLTRTTGKVTNAFTSTDGTGVLTNLDWTFGKTIDGLTLELSIFGTGTLGTSFQLQGNTNRVVVSQTDMGMYGVNFRSLTRGFGISNALFENSIVASLQKLPNMTIRNNIYDGGTTNATAPAETATPITGKNIARADLAIADGNDSVANVWGGGNYKPAAGSIPIQCVGDFLPWDFYGNPVTAPFVGAVQP